MEVLITKIITRLIFGFANGFTNITHLFNKQFDKKRFWVTFTLAITILPIMVAVLGALNPYLAREEELLIGLFIGLPAMFIIKEKE